MWWTYLGRPLGEFLGGLAVVGGLYLCIVVVGKCIEYLQSWFD